MNDATHNDPEIQILPPEEIQEKLPAALGLTDAAIDELAKAYTGLVIVEGDEDSYQAVSEAISTLSGYRTKIEDRRKELKAPILDAGRMIDSEAKRLAGRIKTIEDPLAEQRRKVREAIKRRREEARKAEEERQAKIQAGIDNMRDLLIDLQFRTADQLQGVLEQANDLYPAELEEFYQERTEEALQTWNEVRERIKTRLAERIQLEAEEQERERQAEALRKEREEIEREKEALRQARERQEREEADRKKAADEERIRQEERQRQEELARQAAEAAEREKRERAESLGEIGKAREYLAELRAAAYAWTTDDRRVLEILNRVNVTTSRAITKAESELLQLEEAGS